MKVLAICFFLVFGTTVEAQNKKDLKKVIGNLKEKPWTKSTESYCAQGSEYFVLELADREIILENKSKKKFKVFEDKSVLLQGYFQVKTIPTNNDPYSQRPVSVDPNGKDVDFTCEVFVVKKIKVL